MVKMGGGWSRERHILSMVYFGFYFAVFGSMIFQHRLLSQVRPALFNFNRDLTELAVIATGLPRWMIAHPWSFGVFDGLLFVLPLLWLAAGRRWLGALLTLFLALYLLLADIFWQVHHEPFILYVLLPLALLSQTEERFYQVLKFCRWYFLYIFISAAIWKIARGAVFNGEEMSRILLVHHSELLSGDCTGWACRAYGWLIDHPLAAQGLYVSGVLLEAVFVLGLFTRRYDRLLFILAFVFVVADMLVMRIPYWTLLLGTVTLWLDSRPRVYGMVIYETTHHENLPALLDLCEAKFPQVKLFVKEVSFANLSGAASPADRWPRTEFIVQPAACSNRKFIGRLIRHVRENRYSHLHLATLDNNLLIWSLRLFVCPALQVSMTVHEVNEFFARPLNSLRDWTEALAKPLLYWRIRHYHFFLPAMAEQFHQRMPRATTVFLPSRFYVSPAPAEAHPFTIVIPGSVDNGRRDYDPVLQTFRSWAGPPIHLVLLGDSSGGFGRTLISRLHTLESPVFAFRYYEGYVPGTEYERVIRAADLLWSPLRVHKTGARHNPETYGRTTASGLTSDVLLNNIPALAPAELVLPDPFAIALLSYRDAGEAAAWIQRLSTDPAWREQVRQDIDKAFSEFKKENFTAAFDALTALHEE